MSATRMNTKNIIDDDQSEMARKFTVIWCLVSLFKISKVIQQPHDLESSFKVNVIKNT